MLCKLASLIFITLAQTAAAYDILPEYQGLNESDLLRFERPSELDAEYQSLLNAYALPSTWERRWQDQARVIDFSLGSLSNKQFLLYSRLKLDVDWTESLRFRYIYFAQRDREVDQTRHIMELSQRLLAWLRVSIYGEPSLYKRENDMGVALETESGPLSSRIYYTFHDFTRAEHNDQKDYFTGRGAPSSFGWTGLWRADKLRSRLGFRIDAPVTWVRPQEQRLFNYEKKLGFVDLDWRLSRREYLELRAQWDVVFKSQSPDSGASAVVAESWRLERRVVKIAYHLGTDEEPLAFEVGFTEAVRKWRNLIGQEVSHFNALPSATASWRGVRRGDRFDHLRVGYEMTVFNTFGELSLTPVLQKHNSVENRLSTGYEFSLRSNAKLLLALNFDLDEFTPVPTFEGGQGQFQTDF